MRYEETRRDEWIAGAAMAAVVAVGAAPGCSTNDSEPSNPPEFSNPSITCEEVEDDDVDGEVVVEVTVEVTDPDRDLVTQKGQVCGTLNGLPIALGDPDADSVFSWTPSKDLEDNPCDGEINFEQNRMACNGEFDLSASVEDAEGNDTEFQTTIDKGGAS